MSSIIDLKNNLNFITATAATPHQQQHQMQNNNNRTFHLQTQQPTNGFVNIDTQLVQHAFQDENYQEIGYNDNSENFNNLISIEDDGIMKTGSINPADCYENIYILSNNEDRSELHDDHDALFTPLNPSNIQEIGEDDLLSPIPSPQPPAIEQQHRVHKNVNYFNHKFVISETEDISVDKLISLNEKPVEMVPPPMVNDHQKIVQCKENRVGTGRKYGTLPRGESILRNFDNHKNIPVTTTLTMVSPCLPPTPPQPPSPPPLPPPPTQHSQIITDTQKNISKVFVVDRNSMKPIIAPTNVASGIFRSATTTVTSTGVSGVGVNAKKRKTENLPPQVQTETVNSPKNILILNSTQGKIVPMSDIEEIQNMQQQSVGGGLNTANLKNGSNHQTVQITNGGTTAVGKAGETKQINRRLIKIPLSAFQSVDQTDGGTVTGEGGGTGDKISSKNLVLNIVNMVANNPEITQRTEINHSQLKLENSIVKVDNGHGMPQSTNGNVSVLNDKKSVVYHNRDTNTKIIYRIINPEDVNLKKEESPDSGAIEKTSKAKRIVAPPLVPRNRPGRPKGVPRKRVVSSPGQNRVVLTQPTARTRAGRLSRPPKHVQNYFKCNGKGKLSEFNDDKLKSEMDEGGIDMAIPGGISTGLADATDLQGGLGGDEVNRRPDVQFIKKERKIPSQYKCKTCNKIYLGYSRMARHLTAYPDHGDITQLFQMKVNSSQTYQDSLFHYLLKKIQKASVETRSQIFFDEIKNFVQKMQILGPKLVKESLGCADEIIGACHDDDEVMRLLNIPKGRYFVDLSIFENENFEINHSVNETATVTTTSTTLNDDPTSGLHHVEQHHQISLVGLDLPQFTNPGLINIPQHTHTDHHPHHTQQQQQQQQHHPHHHQSHHTHQEHHLPHHLTTPNLHLQSQHHNLHVESLMAANDRMEYNLNISLDSNDKTNLSEDSLLQSVDEFVNERWKNLDELANSVQSVVNNQHHHHHHHHQQQQQQQQHHHHNQHHNHLMVDTTNIVPNFSSQIPMKDDDHHQQQSQTPPPILDLSLEYLLN